jgi:hypothetical protein
LASSNMAEGTRRLLVARLLQSAGHFRAYDGCLRTPLQQRGWNAW